MFLIVSGELPFSVPSSREFGERASRKRQAILTGLNKTSSRIEKEWNYAS
mgnify:CR=1 FL=1